MTVEVPIEATGEAFRQTTSLDGQPYVFEFTYSRRSERWYLDLYFQTDTDPEPVQLGIPVTNEYPMLLGNVSDNRPLGDLVPIDLAGGADAGLADLGTRVRLFYLT